MSLLRLSASLAALLFACSQARAEIVIGCGGYNRKINDHVEWEIRIVGAEAEFEGERFKVLETKKSFILSGPRSQIRINKAAESYTIVGSEGKKAPALEWSRKLPGEGCDISRK